MVGGAESLFMKREDSVTSRSGVGRESGSAKIEPSPPVTMEDTARGHPIFLISLRYDLRILPTVHTGGPYKFSQKAAHVRLRI